MAKVNGPLLSLNASGTVGKTILYSNWNGRQTCALKNTPSNRRTVPQMRARTYLKCALVLSKYLSRTSPTYAKLKEIALPGQTWSSALTVALLMKRNIGIEYYVQIYESPEFAEIMVLAEEAAAFYNISDIDIDGTENTQFTGGFIVLLMLGVMIDRLGTFAFASPYEITEADIYNGVTAFTGIPHTV